MLHNLNSLLGKLDIAYLTVGKNTRESEFAKIVSIKQAQEHDLIFVNAPNDNTMKIIAKTKASCILLEKNWGQRHAGKIERTGKRVHLVACPRLAVARLLKRIYEKIETPLPGIHHTAIIDEKADIHKSVFIGPYCVIGTCSIGEGSQIYSHTVINNHVRIGKNVIIMEHCVIGSRGFGFVRDDDRTPLWITHVGGVVIEDDVEIFPFANVDCGTFGDTVIESKAKIDHFVHVSHNTRTGEKCIITAGAILGGSASVGANSWVGLGSIVKQGIKVRSRATLGMGAVVLKDVEDNDVVAGVPAKSLRRKEDG